MRTAPLLAALLFALPLACGAPPDADPNAAPVDPGADAAEVAPPAPVGPVPSARQLAWHELEFYAFVHFNMNTFTDEEWGHGTEDPDRFAPTELDCRQWARLAREAGMRAVILTAKHHDGFCLWPSAVTEHDVASSAWRDGRGDVLRDLSEACAAEGLALGLYLSPWDRAEPSYGDSAAYNRHFATQLEEILTNYGPVFEVWFDGACGEGPNGKRQVYDWELFERTVHRLQPDAVIFHGGVPDLRWIGNERGYAGETNWNPYRSAEYFVGTEERPADLNRGHEDGDAWIPGEADVSIRPGWYYHADQDDRVKTLGELADIYLASVGRGTNLLLNLPVDRRGLVHEHDAERLLELGEWVRRTTGTDLARGATATAGAVRGEAFAAANVVGDAPGRYWATPDGVAEASVELALPAPVRFDLVRVMEHLPLGQRVRAFRVEAWVEDGGAAGDGTGGGWRVLGRGTTVGRQRLLEVPTTRTDRVRVVFEDARGPLCIRRIGLHATPASVEVRAGAVDFVGHTRVELVPSRPDVTLRYTLDGSPVDGSSPAYVGPFDVLESCTVRARTFDADGPGMEEARLELRAWDPDDLLPAGTPAGARVPGLAVEVYEEPWQTLDQLAGRTPTSRAVAATVSAAPATRDEHVGLVFEGWLEVPEDGVHTLHLTCDDGGRLFLDGEPWIDLDGLHGALTRSRAAGLAAGPHRLRVEYFQATGGRELRLEWESAGRPREAVPAAALGHVPAGPDGR